MSLDYLDFYNKRYVKFVKQFNAFIICIGVSMHDYLFPYLVSATLEHMVMVNDVAIIDDELIVEYSGSKNSQKDFTTCVVGIMERITPIISSEINSISIGFSMKSTSFLKKIGLVSFSRATWEKINWENFSNHNVSEAADSFWLNASQNK